MCSDILPFIRQLFDSSSVKIRRLAREKSFRRSLKCSFHSRKFFLIREFQCFCPPLLLLYAALRHREGERHFSTRDLRTSSSYWMYEWAFSISLHFKNCKWIIRRRFHCVSFHSFCGPLETFIHCLLRWTVSCVIGCVCTYYSNCINVN